LYGVAGKDELVAKLSLERQIFFKHRCFMRVGLVINPTAGGNKGAVAGESARAVLATSSHEVIELSAETYEAAKAAIKQAIANGAIDALVLVGGDGMAHLGVNVCANTKVPMAIVPAGTGNDAAAMLGMPLTDTAESIRLVLGGLSSPKKIDAIKVSHGGKVTWALGSASAGFDALAAARANAISWPKGPMRYYVAMLLELAKFKPIKYQSVIDGNPRDFEAMLCVVSNTGIYGGGMLVVPGASVTDAKLDVLLVKKMSRLKFVTIFPRVYKGTHITDKDVEIFKASKISITASGMPIYSDGEYVGQAPFEADVVPGALLVIAPAL
jgi:diacylglycerol kinase (ATP)